MSLDYDLRNIKNREEVTIVTDDDGAKFQNPITTNIIFGCVCTQIGTITEANAEEWFGRYHLWNQSHGYEDSFTLDDVKNHIGLSTNVFPKMSMQQWFKERIWRDTLYDVRHGVNRQVGRFDKNAD